MHPSTILPALSFPFTWSFARPLVVLWLTLWLLPSPRVQAHPGTDTSAATQREAEARTLKVGEPVERELAGGEQHAYQTTLSTGQYVYVVVEQRGIDVVVALFGPDNKQLDEFDSPNGKQGPEPIKLVAEATGSYRIEVRPLEKAAPAGRYEISLKELRVAKPQESTRVAAERAEAVGNLLVNRRTVESIRRGIEKWEQALSHWRALGDRVQEAAALFTIGTIYHRVSEHQKASEYYNQTLLSYRATGEQSAGLKFLEAMTLTYLGSAYSGLEDRRRAVEQWDQALLIWQAVDSSALMKAAALENIGAAYSVLDETQRALDAYQQALSLQRAAGDRAKEAGLLSLVGDLYLMSGEMEKALDAYQQALALRRASGDHDNETSALGSISHAYRLLGDEQKALDYRNQLCVLSPKNIACVIPQFYSNKRTVRKMDGSSLPASQPIPALPLPGAPLPALDDRVNEAVRLIHLGASSFSQREYRQALDYYAQALALYRGVGDRRMEAGTLKQIGDTYLLMGERHQAIDYYAQSLPLWQALGSRQSEVWMLEFISDIYASLGEKQRARDYTNQVSSLWRALGDRGREVGALYDLARLDLELGQLDEARAEMEALLDTVEIVRAKITDQDLRVSYSASNQDYYEFYIELLMRMHQRRPSEGFDGAALQVSERARARNLLELLTEAGAEIRRDTDPALLDQLRALQQRLNAKAAAQLERLSGERAAEVKREIESLISQLQQVRAQIRQTSPRYAALTQPQPLSLKEIQAQVLDEETLLLEYALGEERSYLWAVTQTSITSYQLPKRTEIEAAARHVYELLSASNRGARSETAKRKYLTAAASLSRMLLWPVASQLGNKRLVVVADGLLRHIPFEALPDPNRRTENNRGWQPLVVGHEVVNLPSASTLAVLRRELAGRRPAAKTLAVLADPVFTKDDARIKPGARPAEKPITQPTPHSGDIRIIAHLTQTTAGVPGGLRIPRLPFTRQEAERILALVPPGEGMKALNFRASRALALSERLGQYRYVHFATHGLADLERPELSSIVLSLFNERGEPQEGFLRLHEVYNLELPAELVVLSACQTGLGKQVRGEGLVGLTRGFMYAGAARIVVSLWSVNDQATAELMTKFYRKILVQGQRPAAALRAAQIEMWRAQRWGAPYYWSAFTLQGEWH